ncbi:MAG TPA: phosphoribosylamine--glycine ligase [Bdellovibrionota bacterium]|nr:phosphoribosylamine--glycine ligase [Bdellovibrionota bacterium]
MTRSTQNSGKKVLVVGSGGREHALAWKLAQSASVSKVVVATSPGAGEAWPAEWEKWPLGAFRELAKRAREARIDLAVIGPDNPLAEGIVDVFEEAGIVTFGPSAAAARIESSKSFAKEVMNAAGIPTAKHFVVQSLDEARALLRTLPWAAGSGERGWVIKADGLAFGKGVRVCGSLDEAFAAVQDLADSGCRPPLLIEERLSGQEISWMAFCDGNRAVLLDPARDHKRLKDGDQGPNTGGMGAFSPVPDLPPGLGERVRAEVFIPCLRELKRRGAPFRGVLYAGLMFDANAGEFRVLEFNARFGDPETQVILPRMTDDLFSWCEASARGELARLPDRISFSPDAAVFVVGAARGYPEAVEKGQEIHTAGTRLSAPAAPAAPEVFWAGVRRADDGKLHTAGGRVFGALGMGPDLAAARAQAYDRIRQIGFSGMQFRTDIASGALAPAIPIVILASGRGSNFSAIHEAVSGGNLNARILAVISDRPDAPVLEKAKAAGIEAIAVPVPRAWDGKRAARGAHQEAALLTVLRRLSPRFLVLAGYMRLLGPKVIEEFRSGRGYSRIVNVHPSLLPAFPGLGGYAQAFHHGTKVAGVTVHLVDEGRDTGPICAQKAFAIGDCRSCAEVEARGLAIEHELFPETLKWVLPEKFDVMTETAQNDQNDQKERSIRVRPN